jgi:hypothetical protein
MFIRSSGGFNMNIKQFCCITAVTFTSILSGCASTSGSHEVVGAAVNNSQIAKFSDLLITVKPGEHVTLNQSDTDRMTKLIEEDIKTDSPNRFKTINTASPSPATLQASVTIKNYEEGNAFARFMLMGLGQIHIDADVQLSDSATNEKLTQYEVTKTFAWGGFYGAFTKIKDAEVGFCKAVADSVLGKE